MKFHEMGLLTQEKQETGCSIVSVVLLTVMHYNESKENVMKTIRVVAADLRLHAAKRKIATARGYGDYKGQWGVSGGNRARRNPALKL